MVDESNMATLLVSTSSFRKLHCKCSYSCYGSKYFAIPIDIGIAQSADCRKHIYAQIGQLIFEEQQVFA
jgi:hypothetical protein